MADATTTYDVITRYLVDDKSTPLVVKMNREVRTLETSVAAASAGMGNMGGLFGRVGGMIAGYLGFQQGNKHLIQFNSNMEQAKITMAGMMAQAGRGDYVNNLETAATLVKQMQMDARASVGTTQDYVQMATAIVQPLTQVKGTLEDLRNLTKQTVVASRAMGIGADVAARDVTQALMGRYSTVDPFLARILPSIGYSGEAGRAKWRQLEESKRLSELKRALGSKGIADMAKGQEFSFAGVFSTFQDNLQMTLGKVGMPLFKGVTAELKNWNQWLDKNQDKVEQFAKTLGSDILSAATKFKDVMAFAAEHWKGILGSALALKASGALMTFGKAGLAADAAWGGATTVAGAQAAARASKMAGIGSAITIGAITATSLYIVGTEISRYIDERQKAVIANTGTSEAAVGMLAGGKIDVLRQYMAAQGLSSEAGFNKEAFQTMMEASNLRTRGQWADALGLHRKGQGVYHDWQTDPEKLGEAMAKKFVSVIQEWNPDHSMLGTGSGLGWMDKYNVPYAKVEKPKINVTINRIEVATDDPDRFVMKMVGAFRDAAKNPSGVGSALHALREG